MKINLMQTMARIVLPAALTISALAGHAHELDHAAGVSKHVDRHVTVDILDDNAIDEIAEADIKAIDVLDGSELITDVDEPILALDYTRGGVLLDVVENEIVDFDHAQAIDYLDIARTVNY